MSKVQLAYTGLHMPREIVEVDEFLAPALIKRGDYKAVNVAKVLKEKEEVEEVPNETWTEKEIKKWMKEKNVPIKYDTSNEEKADKLKELKDAGYL